MEARHRGEDIVDFGMGNPDLPTPPHVVAKLVEAASKPQNHRYSVSRGIYKLRVAICDWYKRRYQVTLDPDSEAIVTIGAKEGLSHSGVGDCGSRRRCAMPQPDVSDPSIRYDFGGRRSSLYSAH